VPPGVSIASPWPLRRRAQGTDEGTALGASGLQQPHDQLLEWLLRAGVELDFFCMAGEQRRQHALMARSTRAQGTGLLHRRAQA